MAREYSTDSTKLECISLMLEELGIKLPLESSRLLFLFPLFFQVHIPKAKSENKTFQATIQFEPSEILDVYEKYNLERQGKFFMDPICKQLFHFAFRNFQETYLSHCRSRIKQRLKKILDSMLLASKLVNC